MDPVLPAADVYGEFLHALKERIRSAQLRAAVSVNRELVLLYWEIGRDLTERQEREGWGTRVIDRLAADLRTAFPGQQGFSPRNLRYMKLFAEEWPDRAMVQGLLAQLSWSHHIALLEKVIDPAERAWYAGRCAENGWSRNVLLHQIASGLAHRQGRALHNFGRTLPPAHSDLAAALLKSPYSFEFLTLEGEVREKELEGALVEHIRDFLLELGVGFAFMGRQHRIEVGGQEFFLDLLFYHVRLRCYVVIELKVGPFIPESAGKMSFYLAAVDDRMRAPGDQPTIGLILCTNRNDVVVEYTLRDMNRPIGVATYSLREPLPKSFRSVLPSADALMAQIEAVVQGPGTKQE
ncbi:PDDEXK nuclease domain-containing protein [Longimicrobium sp.]|uniref:PDDEXK nuclease domain-containing protein n=1 Tax=Longimicrobium sp. TaxID=2029185 RepID=UPI002CC06810|nr:PDDEXK nuclease domain-containing protein [Longimicrobium sp.]HSU14186.1 PDDEXK nuclease domain-containing protein [Longimicrobium sp.]